MEFSGRLDSAHYGIVFALLVSIKDPWEVAMAEDYTSAHHHTWIWNLRENRG